MREPARTSTTTTTTTTSALVKSGMAELAAGALSGWVYTAVRQGLGAGAVDADRIRQWHLDMAILGTATVAAGLAAPEAPRTIKALLGVGAWTNALAFLPMAFRRDIDRAAGYKVAVGASFVATSVGFSGMALSALRRR